MKPLRLRAVHLRDHACLTVRDREVPDYVRAAEVFEDFLDDSGDETQPGDLFIAFVDGEEFERLEIGAD